MNMLNLAGGTNWNTVHAKYQRLTPAQKQRVDNHYGLTNQHHADFHAWQNAAPSRANNLEGYLSELKGHHLMNLAGHSWNNNHVFYKKLSPQQQ